MRKKWIMALMVFIFCFSIGAGAVQANDEEEVPPLRGGSEKDVRNPETVPLPDLQMEFPEVVFVQGDPESNQVALTFDDGPDPRFTESVLNTLEDYDVPATFFVMGARAEAYPEFLERMEAEGHDVGNHTYWHPTLTDESVEQLEWEVEETEAVIEETIGYRPRLFRPPYGSVTTEQVERLEELNNVVIGWGVDSYDWEGIPAEEVTENVLEEVGPGSIVLMHDGGDWTQDIHSPEALDDIIPELQDQGYEFVTISEMFDIPREK
ncbi:peptidoglycan/xylan/chitin deacetylase (PgdA/CDA1 family) [Geomicrobium halophilum]|uniref:Peptidoglycan/xylan/chitin deacetylase (PgdA/CDA1 family) n=1 Tax=Geomicrobium halophilum TaxID=549000 RepID=A0A841PWU5_9BACL|nr:peptidoglycan/xylan/chitin deacetylase (PgdA/CDA1 family) [Geomicrobium halophilum]